MKKIFISLFILFSCLTLFSSDLTKEIIEKDIGNFSKEVNLDLVFLKKFADIAEKEGIHFYHLKNIIEYFNEARLNVYLNPITQKWQALSLMEDIVVGEEKSFEYILKKIIEFLPKEDKKTRLIILQHFTSDTHLEDLDRTFRKMKEIL